MKKTEHEKILKGVAVTHRQEIARLNKVVQSLIEDRDFYKGLYEQCKRDYQEIYWGEDG